LRVQSEQRALKKNEKNIRNGEKGLFWRGKCAIVPAASKNQMVYSPGRRPFLGDKVSLSNSQFEKHFCIGCEQGAAKGIGRSIH
jgi:hypothetical protein